MGPRGPGGPCSPSSVPLCPGCPSLPGSPGMVGNVAALARQVLEFAASVVRYTAVKSVRATRNLSEKGNISVATQLSCTHVCVYQLMTCCATDEA